MKYPRAQALAEHIRSSVERADPARDAPTRDGRNRVGTAAEY